MVEPLLSIPAMPVHVGLLWPDARSARSCDQGAMELMLCTRCAYVWNEAFDPQRMSYEQDYDNALHHSPKFAAWERALVDGLIRRHDLHERRLAEIGAGDGRFLASLCLAGKNSGIGFEPGHNPDRVSELVARTDVQMIDGFADADSLRGHSVDFVVSRHVLEHLPEPMMLIDAIRRGTVPGAAVYIEVPNFSWALARGAFEDLMYEHCGYYTVESLAHLMHRAGFTVVSASPTFDGLFAAVEAVVTGDPPSDEPVATETVDHLRSEANALAARIEAVETQLEERRRGGQRLVAWGGGARAVGLFNLVSNSQEIECVVDVNPRKQGTYTAGSGHAIVAPEALAEWSPDAVIVVNPVYHDEIAAMLADIGVDAELVTL
ncbi:MAG: class I SAM-dependent methyltransferase [Actinomycetota bacterium]